MMRVWTTTSKAFENIVAQNRVPVILQVIPALESGGAEQGTVEVTRAIVEAGGTALVVSSGGQKVHEITRAGGTHVELPVNSKNPVTMARNVRRLKDLIEDYSVDIVHARSRAPAWSAFRACKGMPGVHFVTTAHAAYKGGSGMKKFYNSVMGKGERVIAVSHFVADYLEDRYKVDPAKIRVIHRGVALERFHPNCVTPDRLIELSKVWRIPEGAAVILLPARLTPIKGHRFLIDAVAQIGRDDVFCIFVGSDQGNTKFRKELEAYIEDKGLTGAVRIVGMAEDLPAAYMVATVVTCPSVEPEGFGRVPIEAQAMGRPIIATDHGGVRESILRDETGWLVPPGDVRALADALRDAMALNDRERAMLATRSMAHVANHFTVEQMTSATLDVYAEVLGGNVAAMPVPDSRGVSPVAGHYRKAG